MEVMEFDALELSTGKEKTSVESIINYSRDIMSNLVDPHYTDHSIAHSFRVLRIIDRILVQTEKQELLTQLEIYILQSAAFLHDIGMQEEKMTPDEVERRQSHELLSVERIKSEYKEIGILEGFVEPICKVVSSHRKITNDQEQTITIRTCETVRIDMLNALLFLGDELDISYERVDIKKKERLNLRAESLIHFYKHYYTRGIDIADDRSIKIDFRCPVERVQQYKIILERYVVRKINQALEDAKLILTRYRIDIFLNYASGIKYEEESTLEIIPVKLYEQIILKLFLPKCVQSVRSHSFREMKGCHDPDLFYGGSTRWEDIVNDLDFERKEYSFIRKKVGELYDSSCSSQALKYFLITGEAGAGKSTVIMRLTYDLAKDDKYKYLNLLWYDGADIFDLKKISNLYSANNQPIIIFIDTNSIKTFVDDLRHYKDDIADIKAPILLVIAARRSEWDNSKAEKVLSCVEKSDAKLEKLDDNEINELLGRLKAHNNLGVLDGLSHEEQFVRLKDRCERQLLVAMLEATRGKRFEDIILDEHHRLRELYPEAARAYELVALFYVYNVSTPKSMLIRLLVCDDDDDFIAKVVKHTRLIIVKDYMKVRFGDYYKARHATIAEVLLAQLDDYDSEKKRLRKVGAIVNSLDASLKHERYYLIDFLKNYIEDVVKYKPKEQFEDRLFDLRDLLKRKAHKLKDIVGRAHSDGSIAELILLSRFFFKLGMIDLHIHALKQVVNIKPLDKISNYFLGKSLLRARKGSPEEVADYYKNSFSGGNRKVSFLLEYLSLCLAHKLYKHIDTVFVSIRDFVSYSPEEHQLKRRLDAALNGYKVLKDRKKFASEISELHKHIDASKGLYNTSDQLYYIDTFETSDPKEAIELCKKQLLLIKPSRPKSILLRLAYISTKLPGKVNDAKKYFDELYNSYLKDNSDPDNFQIVFEYLKFAVKEKSYDKGIYFMLFNQAKRMNKNEIDLYSTFASYLSSSGEHKDLSVCIKVIDEGLNVAKATEKLHWGSAKQLRMIRDRLKKKIAKT